MPFCPVKGSRSWAAIETSGAFCVNVLTAAQQAVCTRVGDSRVADKFAGAPSRWSGGGLPVLDALATIEGSVRSVADGGDHWIVGRQGRVAVGAIRKGVPTAVLPRRLRGHRAVRCATGVMAGRPRTLHDHDDVRFMAVTEHAHASAGKAMLAIKNTRS
jgi:flavin reductase (DIM6/NTAB) family NADH-FMN oxidoreductase RutF